jgi:hypothetical protein
LIPIKGNLERQNTTIGNSIKIYLQQTTCIPAKVNFKECVKRATEAEYNRAARSEVTFQTAKYFEIRCNKYLVPAFGQLLPEQIDYPQIARFVDNLTELGLHSATIRQTLVSLRKVLRWGHIYGHIGSIPALPKVKSVSIPRGGFTCKELLALWRSARALSDPRNFSYTPSHRDKVGGHFSKKAPIASELRWLIPIMVNSFMRPTDARNIQHKHVEIIRGRHIYLRLSLPESKKHKETIITLRPAVRAYEALKLAAERRGMGSPDDFLFYPDIQDRQKVMMVMDHQFRRVLEHANLRTGRRQQTRTVYSLRHTALTFRLIYGQGIDLLTLAKNARTSVEMVERFYASELDPELNVAMLQSRRTRAPGPHRLSI